MEQYGNSVLDNTLHDRLGRGGGPARQQKSQSAVWTRTGSGRKRLYHPVNVNIEVTVGTGKSDSRVYDCLWEGFLPTTFCECGERQYFCYFVLLPARFCPGLIECDFSFSIFSLGDISFSWGNNTELKWASFDLLWLSYIGFQGECPEVFSLLSLILRPPTPPTVRKYSRVSLYVTDDTISKLFVT